MRFSTAALSFVATSGITVLCRPSFDDGNGLPGLIPWVASFSSNDPQCTKGYFDDSKECGGRGCRPKVPHAAQPKFYPHGENIGINWGTQSHMAGKMHLYSDENCVNWVGTVSRPPGQFRHTGPGTCIGPAHGKDLKTIKCITQNDNNIADNRDSDLGISVILNNNFQ